MFQYFRLLGLALLLSVGVGSVGQAASFDCSKATTETEIAICADPELSALDELMGVAYLAYMPTGAENASVKELMAAWQKSRNRCGTNAICLAVSYKAWLHALKQNDIVETLAAPSWNYGGFCAFMLETGETEATYVCFDDIYEMTDAKSACQIGDNVYQIRLDLEKNKINLSVLPSVVEYLRESLPIYDRNWSFEMLKTPKTFDDWGLGRDHYDTGCTVHSCDSFSFQDMSFISPKQYFWLGPLEWEPIVYPNDTMFIVTHGKTSQYPDVSFCRSLRE